MVSQEKGSDEEDSTLVNLEQKSDEELKKFLDDLDKEEEEISYQRRMLHGKIDILRAELTRRLKEGPRSDEGVISGKDVERLSEILARGFGGTKNNIS